MTGEWIQSPLPPDLVTPELDWLDLVSDTSGARAVTLSLSLSAAESLQSAYGERFGLTKMTPSGNSAKDREMHEIAGEITLTQHSYRKLHEFCGQNDPDKSLTISMIASASGVKRLALIQDREFLRLLHAGQSIDPAMVGSGVVTLPSRSPASLPPTDLTGDEVIMAIVDDGIGFANERFRLDRHRSRVEYFWDMSPPPLPGSPSMAETGIELNRQQIDELLARHEGNEEAIYRDCGVIDPAQSRRQPLKFRLTHGTHVLDTAAGYDYRDPAQRSDAAKRPIIAVQMPSEVIAERSDCFTAAWLALALQRIEMQAVELSQRVSESTGQPFRCLPLIVNYSFGTFAGPHDGEAEVEQVIRNFLNSYRSREGRPLCEVVLPAGNNYLARAVARIEIPETGNIDPLPWRVAPDDKTSSYVHIWLPLSNTPSQQIEIALEPPGSNPSAFTWSKLGQMTDWVMQGATLARIYHRKVERGFGQSREQVVIAIRRTASDDGDELLCPAGLWKLHVRNLALASGEEIDIRIRRDDSLPGQPPTGRQSYFDHPDYVVYEESNGRIRTDSSLEQSPVTRLGTINTYATSLFPIVVGGYRRSDGVPSLYTSSGPASSGVNVPTLSAVSDESAVHRGVLASGTYSGSVFALNGTSVAAPQVSRIMGNFMSSGFSRQQLISSIRNIEQAGLSGPRGSYPPVEPDRQGVGRLFTSNNVLHRKRIGC